MTNIPMPLVNLGKEEKSSENDDDDDAAGEYSEEDGEISRSFR